MPAALALPLLACSSATSSGGGEDCGSLQAAVEVAQENHQVAYEANDDADSPGGAGLTDDEAAEMTRLLDEIGTAQDAVLAAGC